MEPRNGLVVPGLLCGALGLAVARVDALFAGACVLGAAAVVLGMGGRGSADHLGGTGRRGATIVLLLGVATLVSAGLAHGTFDRFADTVRSEVREASEDVERKGGHLEDQTERTHREVDRFERAAHSP